MFAADVPRMSVVCVLCGLPLVEASEMSGDRIHIFQILMSTVVVNNSNIEYSRRVVGMEGVPKVFALQREAPARHDRRRTPNCKWV